MCFWDECVWSWVWPKLSRGQFDSILQELLKSTYVKLIILRNLLKEIDFLNAQMKNTIYCYVKKYKN